MSQNKHVKELFDTSIENNFIPMIAYPTRVTETSATLIDHVFVNDKALRYYDKITPGILYSGLSDHLPVFINLNAKINNKLSKERPMVRIYGEKNTPKFINTIQDQDWSNIYHKTSSTEALDFFYNIYNKCYNKAFPWKRISRRRAKDKAWITTELKLKIIHKSPLYKKWIKSSNQENKLKYNQYKNKLQTSLKMQRNPITRIR